MKVSVLNVQGKETGRSVELSDDVFAVEPSEHAVYLDVKAYLANQRQGTHAAKERNAIVGSTRKIKKQKGTGTARAGSIKSGVFRGGGRIFGPRPRSYNQKVNKNLKRLARRSALSMKVQDSALMVIENFDFDAPRTKDFVNLLDSLNISDRKSLFVLDGSGKNVYLSSRNLKGSEVVNSSNLSTYQIMNAKAIVISEQVLEDLTAQLTK